MANNSARWPTQDTSIPTKPPLAVHNREETTIHSELSDYFVSKRAPCQMLHVLAWKVANVSLYERPAKVQCPNISSTSLPLPRPRRRIPSGPSRNFPKSVISGPGAQSPAIQFSPESPTHDLPRCCEENSPVGSKRSVHSVTVF